ncbi:MAG: helix-turn-helix domain-containing protein [Aeoliella sp.]
MSNKFPDSSQEDGELDRPSKIPSGVNLVELAQRIKQKRLEQRLTIEQLAASTGLTRSWLSKVENFRVTPSLPALFKIASNLGVTVAKLVEGIEETTGMCIVRQGEGKHVDRDPSPQNNINYESLAYDRKSHAMEPFLLTIPPQGGRSEPLPHDGEEFLMVLSGQAAIEYGEERIELDEGDCLYFNGSTPHRVFNPHDNPAQVLCVFFVSA